MAILTKEVKVFQCNVCGYEWQRKKKASRSHPTICPECKNPKWNKAIAAVKSEPVPAQV